MYRFTSAIRKVLGSAAATKTRTGYCGNICRRRRICPATRSRTWTRSLCVSISAHEKRWDFKLRRVDCKAVLALQRPIETTRLLGMCEKPDSQLAITPSQRTWGYNERLLMLARMRLLVISGFLDDRLL